MPEKRKDKNGRILKTGEAQRKDDLYMYRYFDFRGKRQCIYSSSLQELRQKEKAIARDLEDGVDYAGGEITVSQLVDMYVKIKFCKLGKNSIRAYTTGVNRIKESSISGQKIKTIKPSNAKEWVLSLSKNRFKRNTIEVILNVIRPAFEMAVEDDMLRKNPFKFNISELISEDASVRTPLSSMQQKQYLDFVHQDTELYYNDIAVLMGTGLRVSELYGITLSDVDLENNCINVTKQLCRTADEPFFILPPKSSSGIRTIPMTESVRNAILSEMQIRESPKVEMMIGGYSRFLFLNKNGNPKVAMNLEGYMRYAMNRIRSEYKTFPKVTPHILRHTFCTKAQQAGLDIKSLQYVMGHSKADMTLDVYSHVNYDSVAKSFGSVVLKL